MQPALQLPLPEQFTPLPRAFKPTEREMKLMRITYRFEGVIADYQIRRLVYDSISWMEARLKLLCDNGYMVRLIPQQRALLPYTVYFLDEKGIDYVASEEGIPVTALAWRKPGEGLALVRHDVELNDLRIAVNREVQTLPGGTIRQWINSRTFWSKPDVIELAAARKRKIIPDGFFHICWDATPRPRQARFLLEYDRRTEDNPRFIADKVIPGMEYIQSEVFKQRYGVNAGDWLIVTQSKHRMKYMLRAAATIPGANKYFYYTTHTEATLPGAFFKAPIWWRPGADKAVALIA